MAMTKLTIDIDEDELRRLNEVCAARGMTVQQMISNFAKQTIGRIPVNNIINRVCKKHKHLTLEDGRKAFYELRRQAQKNGLGDMTMEDINAEIALARSGK